jgi:NCAIR mutase (PurE)-related protein
LSIRNLFLATRKAMIPQELLSALRSFESGTLAAEVLAEQLLRFASPTTPSGVTLDLDRNRRCGWPEVIYGQGKTAEAIGDAMERVLGSHREALATRVAADHLLELQRRFPHVRHEPTSGVVRVGREKAPVDPLAATTSACCECLVVSAGTTDAPVAREALETLGWMGVACQWHQDIGVAGPYRLLGRLQELRKAKVLVAVAGMEAALASVLGGLVACPVIAVPTSVGYGANLGGIAALLGMLSSCAANVAVVNIDAGFKGGYLAGMICRGVPLENEARSR